MSAICYIFGHSFKRNPNPKEGEVFLHAECSRKGCRNYVTYRHDDTEEEYQNRIRREKFEDTFWKSETWEVLKFVALFVTAVAALVLVVAVLPTVITQKMACNSYSKMGLETLYNFWTGCMIKHYSYGWVPAEKYFEILNLFVK